uniref:hypothetical protein n=1 Tax=uncultured Dysgonomonas sp. TaxID=206096 RepID=UPI0025891171|nr:hypothetical protein [uncultured Dysgonomonas sp.]
MSEIKLKVEYYNEDERALFQGYPNVSKLNDIVREDITISRDEFLAYMMFTWQMDVDGFRNYAELSSLIENNLGAVDKLLNFNNDSIQANVIGNDLMQTGYTERIGVSLGLCVLNQIHDLTAADWKKIPTVPGRKGHPTFDFEIDQIASTGSSFIQAENKGCAIKNNSEQDNHVKAHYSSIKSKKEYLRAQEKTYHIPLHKNLYYGTIGVVDNRPNSKAKLLLVDPPAFEYDMDAKKYRLLARLNFYLDEFKNIGVHNKIIKALESRINDIYQTNDIMSFNLKSLIKDPRQYVKKGMLAIVDTDEAFGKIFIVEEEGKQKPYLIAYTKAIMKLIIKQDIDAILRYNYDPDFINEKVPVLMRFTENDFSKNMIAESIDVTISEKTEYKEAIYFSRVKHTNDGRIFGIIKDEMGKSNITEY